MSADRAETAPARLVVVGAGPRAVMLLERLLARHPTGTALRVDLIDPHPPGAGRIWRFDQSPLLKLNSMARDVTVFTDDSCTITGPVRPGPALDEWAALVRDGRLPEVGIDDAGVAAELAALRGDSFPTRRLHSHYLDWFWRTTVAGAPDGVAVTWRQDRVTGVDPASTGRGGHVVHLAGGDALPADAVVYATGHTASAPDAAVAALQTSAAVAGLTYVPPDFTADADVSALSPGADVIVRGMGLAAIDLVVLLGEGRGGRFVRDAAGELQYRPSGREPVLHLGSRRGVPYRSKVSSQLQGVPPTLEVVTAETIAALVARPLPVDFERDVWPLIARELVWAHYRELCTGHPDRARVSWAQFREVLAAWEGDAAALRAYTAQVVPDPLDRFDVDRLDRPLAGERFADAEALQHRLRSHIADDLTLRTTQRHSPSQAVFLAALLSFLALADVPTERWSARSRAVSLPVTWHTFFSYVASGPPAHRLEELLALSRAGVVRFLGPDVEVRIEPGRGFVASSPSTPGETVAEALVDAWLPGTAAARSVDAAVRELAGIHGSELVVADEEFSGSLGRIHVDTAGRVRGPGGAPRAGMFAIGPFTSATEAGAFTRPRSNALSLRTTDALAGELVAELCAVASVAEPALAG